ncbi:universal stress protein [Mycobacterium botniense]|uniref:Universal stress protein n=1 Tax=Mycobacterium botniense TaxID=84962 RepID=A0A7I9Y2E3_9MYCO|nr:universal stress protein [Mycobacterium botniense]GFG76245.1 universal stress protein [Mycobacterium botniense]
MHDFSSAPSIVVGVDGSSEATDAALWAVDEAVSRDVPLRLVSVIDPADRYGADNGTAHYASAHAALYDVQRTVEATGKPVKMETEVVQGKPLRVLLDASRAAVMVCVGSIGRKHAHHGVGSVAAGLAEWAVCPVAVIRRPVRRSVNPEPGSIVADADDGVVLRAAFEEARLRKAPLRIVGSWQAETPDDDDGRLVRARLDRRLATWRRLYPDVLVETVAVRGSICRYVTDHADSVQLFVTAALGGRCELGGPRSTACSVLIMRRRH